MYILFVYYAIARTQPPNVLRRAAASLSISQRGEIDREFHN